MEKQFYGRLSDGREVYTYTAKNDEASFTVSEFGAIITSFKPYGVDIVAGYDGLDGYLLDTSSQGATIGRVANRIADATLTIDGAIYMLPQNNKGNCLHGGPCFARRLWEAREVGDNFVKLGYYSPDGECGFPHGLDTEVTFTLEGATLIIDYKATPEGKTPIALTNHAYFNLDGFSGGNILSHKARIWAENYTAVDGNLIPTGERPSVEGTVFDFRAERVIGDFPEDFAGYDHNFVLSPTEFREYAGVKVGLGAAVTNGKLRMNMYTDQPGVQFYTANFLGGEPSFRGGAPRVKHGAYCLEAQTEPNCVKHGVGLYDAGEVYRQTTVYEVIKETVG